MGVLTTFEPKVELPEVQQEHLVSITPTLDYVQNTTGDGKTVATSCEMTVFTPGSR